ncbi:histone-lysine N-methyltransferase KMT5B-like [Phymastichus coffea]|uniref:histone-lysine N-methyltransferase KMT5B-like n=1 Tax=Phymastichus coffea TaxID=108790 RepID=UPI00273B2C0F|nr:histone-lysine N-methyltransferase KMT5B-like [Phymastichus coffea]
MLLQERKLNFSVINSTRICHPILMLGIAAILNHDCQPNCMYLTVTKSLLIIVTTANIKKGEELYCYYGKNYFGPNNELCECYICEKKQNGYFSKDKVIGLSTANDINDSTYNLKSFPQTISELNIYKDITHLKNDCEEAYLVQNSNIQKENYKKT